MEKSITFIACDKGEKLLADCIIKEAKRRGYSVTITGDIFAEDEIVFYCQHQCFPKNRSKLSCIMLHDLGQQHGLWPNIWIKENWDKFDVGFLPNKEWSEMWHNASKYSFVRPRNGCFCVGWPKTDILNGDDFHQRAKSLAEKLGLQLDRRTVLYAPSWENDNKQLDFVNAFKNMNVNMLIKHYPVEVDMFPEQYHNINEMADACRDMKDVFILDPTESIFSAIVLSDILISEESSTLLENMLMGKPSIAVTDWLIPDQNPPRLPVAPYEFVVKTDKTNIQKTALDVLANYETFSTQAKKYRDMNFPHIGNTAGMVMDVIDAYVDDKESPIEPIPVLPGIPMTTDIKRKRKYWRCMDRKGYVLYRYCLADDANQLIKFMYCCYKFIKKLFIKSL
jgi:hypothetical protein